ncbi:MAG: TPM domain-containing protein [Candidatus Cybelea sp.]
MRRSERAAIARAIAQAEDGTSGRIAVRIVPDATLDAIERAKHEFGRIGLHRHDRANAALILVAPQARSFAVIGDRALHERVGDDFWSELVRASQPYFARGEVPEGVIHVVVRLGEVFKAHFACD